MIIAKMLEKGQIVIPKEVRNKVDISPGDKVEIKVTKDGVSILPLKKSFTESYAGCVKGKLTLEELDNLYAEKP